MSFVRALFCGPGAFRALAPGRTLGVDRHGAVELVFDRCAYVRLDSDWLLVAEPSVPFGPLSVAVAGFDRLDPEPGLPVRVSGGGLVLGAQVVSLERTRARGGPVMFATRPGVGDASAAAALALPDPPDALRDGLAALAAGRALSAVRWLAGAGGGLTPAGDDVLAGYAAARAAFGAPVTLSPAAAGRSSPLGLAYLRCAERGELPDVAARVLVAIRRGSRSEVAATVPALSMWGATSGIALGWGLVAGATSVTSERGVHREWRQRAEPAVGAHGPPAAASVGPGGPVRSGSAAPTPAIGRSQPEFWHTRRSPRP